ncbi:hypothetical protein, partial [Pseudomonas sp. FW306-02-F02-AA]
KPGELIYVEMRNGSVYKGKYLSLNLTIENGGIQVKIKHEDIKTATFLIPSEVSYPNGEVKIPPPHTS